MAFSVGDIRRALRDLDSVRYGTDDLGQAMERIVGTTHDLFAVDGAALMLVDDDATLRNAAVSDDRLARLEELQLRHDSGPCIEAFRSRTLVASDDLTAEGRWHDFATEAVDAGLRALLASPIPYASDAVGVVAVFSAEAHAWTPEGELALLAFTDLAALAIATALQSHERGERADQLQQALEHRNVIEQAKGVLMAQRGIGARPAFDQLRKEARRTRRKVADVAAEVVRDARQDEARAGA